MKKIPILALVALLMVFGCAKDDLINTEQDSVVIEENSQTVFNKERRVKPGNGVNSMSFWSKSISNSEFVYDDCLPTGRILLKKGYFSGTLDGFGTIKTSMSTYEFIDDACKELPIDSPPNYGEPLMYYVVAQGKIALGSRDYCSITITGNLYPWYYTEYGFDGGQFIGTAKINSGAGKLKGLHNKSFEVYSGSPSGPTINIETGAISLNIREKAQ